MQTLITIEVLPQNALDAATEFYRHRLSPIDTAVHRENMVAAGEADDIVIVLPTAPSDHRDWRQAAVRNLARNYAPVRINAVAGPDGPSRKALIRYLASAAGVTGQYLPVA